MSSIVYTKAAIDTILSTLGGGSTPGATETVAGKAEVATQAETDTGTDDARMLTPKKLAGSALASLVGSVRSLSDATFVTNLKATLVARDWSMPSADPAATSPAWIVRQLNAITTTSVELVQMFNGTHKSYWHNEGGNPRSESYAGDQVAMKLFGYRGSGGQTGNIFEVYDVNGLLWGIGAAGRPKLGPNAISGYHLLVLSAAASVPAGTPANTVILRTTT